MNIKYLTKKIAIYLTINSDFKILIVLFLSHLTVTNEQDSTIYHPAHSPKSA